MARLQAHDWPGNIRELRNVLERARLFADDGIVRPEHLPEWLEGQPRSNMPARASAALHLPSRSAEAGDDEIQRLLAEGRLSRREMAERLGLSERTFYRRLQKLGVG
jgi:DNA-binding NtrC family response regulator